jgi:hypothetical protein
LLSVLLCTYSDGSAAYTYSLKRNGTDVVETRIDHRKLDQKADIDNETSADMPDLVAYRARECVAFLRVADALNAGMKTYSLIDRDFDWAQFQVGITVIRYSNEAAM